jgi:CorA-like Mg2+ transporter protein
MEPASIDTDTLEAPASGAVREGWLRRVSAWRPGSEPTLCELDQPIGADAFKWIELACSAEKSRDVLAALAATCPGLTHEMLCDLLTPDEAPAGSSFDEGQIKLASTFSIEAARQDEKRVRGTAKGAGVIRFQPVEILAGPSWLISCWHPRRIFQGAKKIGTDTPSAADDVFGGVAGRWVSGTGSGPGDLGVAVMHELALSYAPAHRRLFSWLEDWELSLYVEDDLESRDQLPELWGLMAVFRDWLNPLNRPGLRADLTKAWLPASDHRAVIEVDDRIDKALAALSKLSETLRQSFSLLHLEQTEEQRSQSERVQHRIELAAAAFLVPTLIVGFYGANTWVPGQGRHWGFWVMVVALVVLSAATLLGVAQMQHRSRDTARRAARERERMRTELLRGND